METESYSISSLIAQWATAIGTIGATIVALHFARRDRKVRINIICNIATLIIPTTTKKKEIITITVTNLGYREIIIDHLYWKLPFDKVIQYHLYNPTMIIANTIPINLAEGQVGNFPIEIEDFAETAKKFIKSIKLSPILFSRFIRFGVYITTRKKKEVYIGKELRKWMISLK